MHSFSFGKGKCAVSVTRAMTEREQTRLLGDSLTFSFPSVDVSFCTLKTCQRRCLLGLAEALPRGQAPGNMLPVQAATTNIAMAHFVN